MVGSMVSVISVFMIVLYVIFYMENFADKVKRRDNSIALFVQVQLNCDELKKLDEFRFPRKKVAF